MGKINKQTENKPKNWCLQICLSISCPQAVTAFLTIGMVLDSEGQHFLHGNGIIDENHRVRGFI